MKESVGNLTAPQQESKDSIYSTGLSFRLNEGLAQKSRQKYTNVSSKS